MKHIFILNPAAGKHKKALDLIPHIEEYFQENPGDGDYEYYITKCPNDAEHAAKSFSEGDSPVRLYACGGDGTLAEVLNGSFGRDNVEIGFFPCGSANDYIKSMNAGLDFSSVKAQVAGAPVAVDVIDCNGCKSLNICCIGLDADVADKMAYFKRYPLVTGPMAYNLALAYMFFHKLGKKLNIRIETGGETLDFSGEYILTLAANGKYYGGGYRGAPQAVFDDGLLDIVLIDTLSRLKILNFVSRYKRGEHLDLPFVHVFRGNKMTVVSDKPVVICADGECFSDREITFEILPLSAKFVLPRIV
jgi:diacylglycerol kinase (ATP)